MHAVTLGYALFLAAAGTPPAPQAVSPTDARAVVERAIQAHGGREKLERVRADRVRMRGVAYGLPPGQGQGVPFENEILVSLPGRFKSVMRLSPTPGKDQTLLHVIDGDVAAVILDGQRLPLPAAQHAQLRQSLQTNQAVRLVPLLTDPGFTISPLGEVAVPSGTTTRPALGVRVVGHGQREVRLFFDRPSGLLVKTEHQLDGAGKDVRQEMFYSQFREVGGYLRPGKVVAYRDGRKVLEADLVEATPLERIDPSEFTLPPPR